MSRKRLYTPQLRERNVRGLYRMSKKFHMPMTKMLNLIVSVALEDLRDHAEGEYVLCDDFTENAVAAVMAQSQNSGIHQTGHLEPAQIREYGPLHHEHR